MKTEFPHHPEPHTYTWTKLEVETIREAMVAAYNEGAETERTQISKPQQPTYGWLIAADEELVCAHLGVAELSDSYETAKRKLKDLLDWHVSVATDPAVNGGFSLQPSKPEPLSDEWIRERCSQTWVFETAKQWVRLVESAILEKMK